MELYLPVYRPAVLAAFLFFGVTVFLATMLCEPTL